MIPDRRRQAREARVFGPGGVGYQFAPRPVRESTFMLTINPNIHEANVDFDALQTAMQTIAANLFLMPNRFYMFQRAAPKRTPTTPPIIPLLLAPTPPWSDTPLYAREVGLDALELGSIVVRRMMGRMEVGANQHRVHQHVVVRIRHEVRDPGLHLNHRAIQQYYKYWLGMYPLLVRNGPPISNVYVHITGVPTRGGSYLEEYASKYDTANAQIEYGRAGAVDLPFQRYNNDSQIEEELREGINDAASGGRH